MTTQRARKPATLGRRWGTVMVNSSFRPRNLWVTLALIMIPIEGCRGGACNQTHERFARMKHVDSDLRLHQPQTTRAWIMILTRVLTIAVYTRTLELPALDQQVRPE